MIILSTQSDDSYTEEGQSSMDFESSLVHGTGVCGSHVYVPNEDSLIGGIYAFFWLTEETYNRA